MSHSLASAFGVPGWFFAAVAALVGACIGSFLNVLIVRLPAGKSVVRPGSHCVCGAPIRWFDNLPVLSWLLLRGRARCCGVRISARYPAVEALTALCFLACWRADPPGTAVCGWVLFSALIGAAFIDLEHLIIPEVLTIGLGLAGLALSLAVPALHGEQSGFFPLDSVRSGFAALLGLLIGSGLVLWIAVVAEAILKQEAMGLGDVIFAGAIGTFCGWHGAVFAVFGGAAVGTVGLLLALIWRTAAGRPAAPPPPAPAESGAPGGEAGPAGRRHVPFGPMLAAAAGLYFLWLHPWVDAWFREVTAIF